MGHEVDVEWGRSDGYRDDFLMAVVSPRSPWCFRRVVAGAVIAALMVGGVPPAGALPPPPPNPSDEQLAASQDRVAATNAAVAQMSAQVAATQGQIELLNDDMALKTELSMKAAVDLDVAVADAQAAADGAKAAAAAAADAQTAIGDAEASAEAFAAASFRQGSQLGSVSAFMDARSVTDLLQRDELLSYVSVSQLDVIGDLQRARVGKANLDAAAREAMSLADLAQAASAQAKVDADAARAAAAAAVEVGRSQLATLQTQLVSQQISYRAAVNTVGELQSRRAAYDEWLVLKAAEEERLRKEAEEAARKAAAEEAARQAAAEEAARQAAMAQAAQAAAVKAEAKRRADAAAAAERQAARDAQAAAAKPRQATPVATTEPGPKRSSGSSSDRGAAVIAAAREWIGTTYAWGGGTASGPSRGIRDGGRSDTFGDYNRIGFDCSGLTLYAYAQVGISLPHYSGYQFTRGSRIARADLQPGDLLFWANNTSDPTTIHHVAIWLGDDRVLEARQSGTTVTINPMRWSGGYIGATRPGG